MFQDSEDARCLNCQALLRGRYCSECGQAKVGLTSVRDFIRQFLDDYLSLDNRLFRTLWPLVFKPGFLSAEYAAGRRQRYLSPIRLYLIASVLFFFVVPIIVGQSMWGDNAGSAAESEDAGILQDLEEGFNSYEEGDDEQGDKEPKGGFIDGFREGASGRSKEPVADSRGEASESAIPLDALTSRPPVRGIRLDDDGDWNIQFGPGKFPINAWSQVGDSLRVEVRRRWAILAPKEVIWRDGSVVGMSQTDTLAIGGGLAKYSQLSGLPAAVQARVDSANADVDLPIFGDTDGDNRSTIRAFGREREIDPQQIPRRAWELAPKMLFVLFPLFALLLKLIYVRRGRYYVEHLIFSLHSHAFLFLLLTPAVLTRREWAGGVFVLISLVYLFVAMKRFYGQGFRKTAFKFWLLSGGYLAVLFLVALLTIAATLYDLTM